MDGTSVPTQIFVEFEFLPWWRGSSEYQGKLRYEMNEPKVSYGKVFMKLHAEDLYLLKRSEVGEDGRKSMGLFSVMSGEISLPFDGGRFNGNCKSRERLWPGQ